MSSKKSVVTAVLLTFQLPDIGLDLTSAMVDNLVEHDQTQGIVDNGFDKLGMLSLVWNVNPISMEEDIREGQEHIKDTLAMYERISNY
jgi:hypothetical protein